MRTAILMLFAVVVCHAGDAPAVHDFSLMVGKGELLRFDRDVSKVVIAEPKIADAIVISPRDVMVNAKSSGHTTLVIWDGEDRPVQYEISVLSDTSDVERLNRMFGSELKSALPTSDIAFSGNAELIVLTGRVDNAEQARRAEALASTYAKKVQNLLQVPDRRQILLQVKFAEVDRVALSQWGFNLLSRNTTTLGATSTQQFSSPLFTQLQFTNNQLSNTNINASNLLNLFIFRPDLNLGATIQALEQQNVMQILAEPNLIVVEGSEASFLAGGEFPFPTIATTPTTAGIAPVVTIQFKKFGVQLNFSPTITATGAINLKIKPEVSALDWTNAVTIQGYTIPALSTREAETEVVLKDGESFAIAGLLDNRVTQQLDKIKFLGDIPILGQLFQSRSTQKSTDELMVVVTPHFVKSLAPDEKVPLPDTVVPYLPTVKEQQAAKDAKKKKNRKNTDKDKKPELVGASGHQVPNQ